MKQAILMANETVRDVYGRKPLDWDPKKSTPFDPFKDMLAPVENEDGSKSYAEIEISTNVQIPVKKHPLQKG